MNVLKCGFNTAGNWNYTRIKPPRAKRVMKPYGNVILMAVICIVIFWIFMALRPAQADAVYEDRWLWGGYWSGCKEKGPSQYDEEYYSCENGRDFEFFKGGYKRGGRICKIDKFEDLPGPDSPRLVWATCKEGGIEQLEILKMFSCCGVLMIKRGYVYPELTQ